MGSMSRWLAPAAVAAVLCACADRPPQRQLAALDSVTSAIIKLPITTSVETARNHFLQGQREMDLGRFIEANAHFKQAVAADSMFAYAYLQVANTGTSLEEFRTNLAHAERHAAHGSEAERLLIQMARKGFENDLEGQLALARRLTQSQPESPRAWIALGDAQGVLNRNEAARASYGKALELAPRLFVAHTSLGNSYLFARPRDFTKAQEHMQHAVDLASNEPWPHDLLGDAHRALNNLEMARQSYTRAHELDPTDASPLQQRGHVNSFLGDWAAARADYDSAIARGRANEKAAFGTWRALVSVYAGEPKAAIEELNRLTTAIDGMNIPEPRGVKAGALFNAAAIAIHGKDFAAAEQALKQRSQLMMQQAEATKNPAFQRSQEASIAYMDGWLAARKGDYAAARRASDRVTRLVQPDANPRKMEPVHELLGFIALYQGNNREAARHFEQGNLDNIYIKYHLAVALDGAGNTTRAKELYRDVATWNFNNVGYALVRQEAQRKAS